MIINPTSMLNDALLDPITLENLVGFIPTWLQNIDEEEDLVDGLTGAYGFGELYRMEGTIMDNGTYKSSYKGDPDLYPIVQINRKHEIVYIYSYGIVSIVYKDDRSAFITRMD